MLSKFNHVWVHLRYMYLICPSSLGSGTYKLALVCHRMALNPARFAMTPLTTQDSSKGVQWKQGVVVYIILTTGLLYHTIPIRCTPLPLHPPVMNIHNHRCL